MYNIKNRKILFLNVKRLFVLVLVICFLSFFSISIFKVFVKGEKVFLKFIVIDFLGRKVEIENKKNKRFVVIGLGVLRFVLYVNGINNIVGVENVEKVWEEGSRIYIMVYL